MTTFKTGMVSVTFRDLSPADVIGLVKKAGQEGIEWGGDVHVPHGDTARAEAVGRMTREAGLQTAAYGSYYRAGETEGNPDFAAVLDSARALGAPTIRVWAGKRASADADPAYRAAVENDLHRCCALAAEHGLRVALEFHGNTLTDTAASANALLDALPVDNLDTLWQPPNGQRQETCVESLRAVKPRISNVHVFHWGTGWSDKRALAEGTERWNTYLRELAGSNSPRWLLMEFVKGGTPERYLEDAGVLGAWVANLG